MKTSNTRSRIMVELEVQGDLSAVLDAVQRALDAGTFQDAINDAEGVMVKMAMVSTIRIEK